MTQESLFSPHYSKRPKTIDSFPHGTCLLNLLLQSSAGAAPDPFTFPAMREITAFCGSVLPLNALERIPHIYPHQLSPCTKQKITTISAVPLQVLIFLF